MAERTKLLSEQAETLRRVNAELEQFAYVASHDLQEPLRQIAIYIDLLQKRYLKGMEPRALGHFARIGAAALHMREMVTAVLEFSRVADEVDQAQVVPLAKAVQPALEALSSEIAASGARISLRPLPTVRGNAMQLTRVFLNLVGNALKFRGPDTPEIEISAQRRNDAWEISVSDNGLGIEPQYREQVFELFRRLHAGDKPGSGIGLATCRRIVERHGGRIWVASAPGEGSVFRFTLPCERST